MKVTLSWLRELVPDLRGDPFELGDVLSGIGLCCDEVLPLDSIDDRIVLARVLDLRPHPDADRVQLVDVDAGDGQALQICCGAFNMAVGDVVPLATISAVMPNGMEIARRKLRGEWSNGMLCSSRELGIGDDHDGIMILPSTAAVLGTALVDVLELRGDALFDLDLTPNRPDALCVLGIARDLAAKLGLPLAVPDPGVVEHGVDAASIADVEIVAPDLCGRFTARVLSGIRTDAVTPPTIARRLTLCGMRPISPTVDISNYVMLELGQPSHAFDLAKVAGARLRVRRSAGAESIVTLDGVTRELVAGDGVIADGLDSPVAIAGVMGGASTEIDQTSTDVLLEMAWWDPASVGNTSARLGLRSEASNRYHRGVDIEVASLAVRRFAQLAHDITGAVLHPGEIVRHGDEPPRHVARVRPGRVNAVLGSDLDSQTMVGILDPIGFEAAPVEGSDDLVVTIPTWRPDSTGEIDVIEEIARLHGYERLGKTVPRSPLVGGLDARQASMRHVRNLLVGSGLVEVTPNPFLSPDDLDRCGLTDDPVVISNPLVAEESVLRTSLLPGLVKTLAFNATHRARGLSCFEIGDCSRVLTRRSDERADQIEEWTELTAVFGGGDAGDAVRFVRGLLTGLGVGEVAVRSSAIPGLHPGRSGIVASGDDLIGSVGEVDPRTCEAYGLDESVACFSLRVAALLDALPVTRTVAAVSRYPAAEVDLAFVVADGVPTDRVSSALGNAHPLVRSTRLFDVYRGPQVPDATRSLAFRLVFQAADHTLDDEEIGRVRDACIATVVDAFGAELRSG